MINKIILIIAMLCALSSVDVIAQDSTGIVVLLKEEYGGCVADTCTVLSLVNEKFVCTHKYTRSTWFPAGNWTIVSIEAKSE